MGMVFPYGPHPPFGHLLLLLRAKEYRPSHPMGAEREQRPNAICICASPPAKANATNVIVFMPKTTKPAESKTKKTLAR